MPRYVAFLRGMNLGKRRLPMSRLKSLFEEIGFASVETFIASGNVLFTSKVKDTGKLETVIATHLEKSLGYRVDTFVRTGEAVAEVGRSKIFPEESQSGVTIHVGFFQQKLLPETAKKLSAFRTPEDEFCVIGRDYYWLCRVRTSESKVWASPELKELRLPTSTMRNITSLRKLIAKHLT